MVIDQYETESSGFGHAAAFPDLRPIMPGRPESTHPAGIRARWRRTGRDGPPFLRRSGRDGPPFLRSLGSAVIGRLSLLAHRSGGQVRPPAGAASAPAEVARSSGPGGDSLLLRMFCHELRSPIESLRSLTRALAQEPVALTPEQRRGLAALAQEQAAHLAVLWRQAVSVTQSLAAPVDRPVPLRQVLPTAVTTDAPHRMTVRLSRRAADRPVHAHRIRQIITNLVDNALRHGPAEGRVRVSASVRAGALVLVVTDEGRSCRPLLTALRRTAPPPGVSGLGLWIVRHLVAAEGGTITAYRATRGVTVRVSLPVSRHRIGGVGTT